VVLEPSCGRQRVVCQWVSGQAASWWAGRQQSGKPAGQRPGVAVSCWLVTYRAVGIVLPGLQIGGLAGWAGEWQLACSFIVS
jgi:hypothetical protein